MSRSRPKFIFDPPDTTRISDEFMEGAGLLIDLRRRGVIDAIGERLRIRRQGGFPGLDIVVLLVVFYTANLRRGLRTTWRDGLREQKVSLAALAGRRRLPSPPAVSRALKRVELDLIRQGTDWLLGEASGVDEMMKHPAAAAWDVLGDPWHVFDLDPTSTVIRHRALPLDEELPEPRRRSEDTGTRDTWDGSAETSSSRGSPYSTPAPAPGCTSTSRQATATGPSTWSWPWTPSSRPASGCKWSPPTCSSAWTGSSATSPP